MAIELSEQSKKLVGEIDKLLVEFEDFDADKYMFADDIKTVLKDIARIKKEFESEVFFVANIGAIKSGKSTLINLLAHSEVSTTKQGKETTIRPAIISKGEKSEILIFTPNGSLSDEEKSKAFDESIDFIKGWKDQKDLTKVKVAKKNYSPENISKYLTQKEIVGEAEPLLVNVRVAIDTDKFPSSLLSQNVVIVDTPGIDGILAGVEGQKEDTTQYELMTRIDMVLFLQSSITPINEVSNKYIKKLKNEHKISNMRLVHNQFSLKDWREKYGILVNSNSDEESLENAKKIFKPIVSEIKYNIIDFAKAEDGYENKINDLLKESGFLQFEKDLLEDLQMNRSSYKEKRVNDSFQNLLDKNIGNNDDGHCTLKTIQYKITNKEAEWEAEEKGYIDILDKISDFFTKNERVLNIIDKPYDETQGVDDGWELDETIKYTNDSDKCPSQKNLTISVNKQGSRLLAELESLAEAENKHLMQILDKRKTFNHFISTSKPNNCDKTIGELIGEFNNKNTKIQLKAFEFNIDMNTHCKKISIDANELYSGVLNWLNKLSVGLIGLKADQIKDLESSVKKEIQESAKVMVEGFQSELKEQIKIQFSSYCEIIERTKGDVKQILSDSRGNQKEHLKNCKNIHQELKEFFSNNK